MTDTGKSWQQRLNQEQDDLAVDFVESISVDARLAKYDIAGSIAHAEMLRARKLLTADELQTIKRGLNDIAADIDAGRFTFDKRYEDIHMVIEAALIDRIGEAGKKLHTGRSRNDQVALDLRLWLRDATATLAEHLTVLQNALVKLADRQGRTVMPGYTHLQRAQPVTLGCYLLAFVEMFERDRDRLAETRRRLNVCPLGSGALAGTSLPLDRQHVACRLGFPAVTRNSIDSTADRDYALDFAFACAMITQHLSRLAEDWIIFCSQEFAFLRLDDAYCTGSSMMPQKRNPDLLELIRGKCAAVYGNLTALLTLMKALPLTYNRDMQEDKKQIFAAFDTTCACLRTAAALVRHSRFDKQRITAGLDAGFLDATALAEYLVRRNVPFRRAHQIVGRLVAQCEQQGRTLAELPLETLQAACPEIAPDVYDTLGAENVAARYAVEGAAGLAQLEEQLTFWKKRLADNTRWD